MQESGINFNNAECWQIQSNQLEEQWWKLVPFIEKWLAVTHGEFSLEDILRLALASLIQLFIIHTAGDIKLVAITEYVQYPQKKVLRIVGIAGEKPILAVKFWKDFENWAKANGAVEIETYATPETVKINMRLGMHPTYTLMRKSLD